MSNTQTKFNKRLLALIVASSLQPAFAHSDGTQHLDEIVVSGAVSQTQAFSEAKASDILVNKESLRHRSSTLGNALAGTAGIHSNPFGGGASAPVVRGQDGVRVKILQNSLGVTDMSTLSPDHAIAADSLLANRIEIVRGASTLMHANASTAGVINVIDERIPSTMPTKIVGEVLTRFTTGSDEQLITAAVNVPIGQHFALRIEGMGRDADPYNVPAINFDGTRLNYLPDSYNQTGVSTVGLSYIGEKGYIGIAHSNRSENYGLVGHNHKYDACAAHVVNPDQKLARGRHYLLAYKHLMDDSDLVDGLHFHCGNDHGADHKHSHNNPYGHHHDHTTKGPWLEMQSENTSLQAEWNNPIKWIDKIRLQAAYNDYKHSEFDEGKTIRTGGRDVFVKGHPINFSNLAKLAKLSVHHSIGDRLQLVWGGDYQNNRTYALIQKTVVDEKTKKEVNERSYHRPLIANTQTTIGLFGLSKLDLGKVRIETGVRHEISKIPVEYDLQEIESTIKHYNSTVRQEYPDLTTYKKQATSYAITTYWDITDNLRLDSTYSHNERIPSPMELYYHGKHLATNSFLFGKKDLDKEKSDNLELGINYQRGNWNFKGSLYNNQFANYIHPENLYKEGNLAMRRFTQSKGNIKGLELELGYQFNPNYRATLFGDIVRGRLYGFDPIFVGNIYGNPIIVGYDEECDEDPEIKDKKGTPEYDEECGIKKRPILGQETIARPDRHAPRMSPARLGFRLNAEYGKFSSSLEYIRVFSQKRTSRSVAAKYWSECPYHNEKENKLCPIYIDEDVTAGYNLLNIGVDYHNHWRNIEYTLSLRANNLLNEKIYIHNSFLPFVPQQGRNLMFSLHAEF